MARVALSSGGTQSVRRSFDRAGHRQSSVRPATFRGGGNVASRAVLADELVPPSAANVDFTYFWLRLLTEADPRGLGQQNIRKAIVRGLRDHIEFEQRFQSGASRIAAYHPLPHGMAVELIRALEQVNAGESPLLFSPPRTKDGRGNLRTSSKQGAVDHAVRYVTAVQLGWIEEREPGERVARLYGVSRRQVQRWIKAAGSGSVRKKAVVAWAVDAGFPESATLAIGKAINRLIRSFAKRYRTTPPGSRA
jgi:hypothetical protein